MSTESVTNRKPQRDGRTPTTPSGASRETSSFQNGNRSGIWSVRMRWLAAAALRRAARRDPHSVEISGHGANETSRIKQCYREYETSMTQERLEATRDVTPMLDKLLSVAPELAEARVVLSAAAQPVAQEHHAAAVLPGEESMTKALQDLRQQEERSRRGAEALQKHASAAVVQASLQARVDVLAERIRARVRIAQAGGMAAYHQAAAKIDYYAEHLIRCHPEGPTLVQLGWPHPLREPATWLTDDREALRLICGSASWTAFTSDGDPS